MMSRWIWVLVLAWGCGSDDKLSVNNDYPEVLITSHADGDTIREGAVETFIGVVTDNTDAASELAVTWYANGVEACPESVPTEEGTTSCTISSPEEDYLTVRLDARDPKNAMTTAEINLDVVPTDAPEVTIIEPTGEEPFLTGEPIGFEATVTDGEDEPGELELWFESNLDGRIEVETTPTSSGELAGSLNLSEGTHDLALWARDTDGKTDRDRVTVDVVPPVDQPPVAIIIRPEEDTEEVFYSDQLIELAGEATDNEDGPSDLLAEWQSSMDGVLAVDATVQDDSSITSFANLSEGEHVLTLTVTDLSSQTGTDSVVVNVGPPNTAPDCGITQPEDESVVELGVTVLFEATASDPDVPSDWLDAQWSSDKDGALGTSTPTTSGEISFGTDALSADTHTITLSVTDEVGETCTDAILIQVSTPPELTVTSPVDGAAANDGEAVSFAATATDAEDAASALVVSWESSLDGTLSSGAPDSLGSSAFVRSDLSVGTHTLTVSVTDTDGLYVTAVQTLTINGIPSTPEVAITPEDPQTADDLVATVTLGSTDTDGDPVSYTYAWYRDGVDSGETSATLSSSLTARGQGWSVSVSATDGMGASPSASASVTIGNTAPEVSGVAISPASAASTDTLTCTAASATDADGDSVSLSYAWMVNGFATGVTTTSLSGVFSSGDEVVCTATPFDGTAAGAAVSSAAVVIENIPPSITGVTITPSDPVVGDALVCTWEGFFDADGDPDRSSASWEVNGFDVGTGTLLSRGFVGGDTVTCMVTPSDGSLDGFPRSDSVVVGNSAPRITGVTISPSSASAGDELTCSYTGYFDPDGDADASILRWYVNGYFMSYSDTLSSGYSRGDTVSCEVTPYDGEDLGDVVSVDVTIENSAPSIDAVSIAPSSASAGDTLVCSYSGYSDPDGDSDASTIAWTIDGISAGTGATLSGGFGVGDEVACTVTPSDGEADGAALSDSITIDNAAPEVSGVSISADGALRVGVILTCSATVTDADGESPTVSYGWTDASGVSVSTAVSVLVTSSMVDPGDSLTCTVTAEDAAGDTDSGSDSVAIGNTDPVLHSVSISPSSGVTASTELSCSGSATDADGGTPTLSYVWLVSGASAGTGSTLDLSTTGAGSSDTVTCRATATDAHGGVASDTASVSLDNTAPSVVSATITPTSPDTNDTLSMEVTASDADGDDITLSYVWYVDGALVSTGSTLDGSTWFDKGQVVYAEVTPDDGTVAGSSFTSDSVTVVNSTPGAPAVSIDSDASGSGLDICNSIHFDGDGDYLNPRLGGATDPFGGLSKVTIEVWLKPELENEYSMLIGTRHTHYGSRGTWLAVESDSTPKFRFQSGGIYADSKNIVVPFYGEWTHVAVVFDGSLPIAERVKYYMDGVLFDTVSWDVAYLDSGGGVDSRIGRNWNTDSESYVGNMSDLRIWNSARYADEIADYMIGPPDDGSGDLAHHWMMDEGSGTTFTPSEYSGGSLVGNIHGPVWATICETVVEGGTLTCSVDGESVDADGDDITYSVEWTLDEDPYTDTSTSTHEDDTVSLAGDSGEWECTVTPDDGEDEGTAATASYSGG